MEPNNADQTHTNASQEQKTPPMQTADNSTVMGVLSYLGPLVIVSYLTAKDNPFVKFHVKQGLVLFTIEIVVWILTGMIWVLWPILHIVNLGTLILSIVGIINVVHKKQQELPLIGKYASHFNI